METHPYGRRATWCVSGVLTEMLAVMVLQRPEHSRPRRADAPGPEHSPSEKTQRAASVESPWLQRPRLISACLAAPRSRASTRREESNDSIFIETKTDNELQEMLNPT
jgi:hypothetical protein